MGWRRIAGIVASVGLIAGLLSAIPTIGGPGAQPASAAVGSQFNPGDIISDGVFYDSGTMSVAQVQAFLNARVPTCRTGYTCLKSYRQNTSAQPARSEGCAAMGATTNETAASIIVRVGRACGINPRVLIVLLEKEQGLVSDTWPTSRQYRSATGYGCPDTADCDAQYYGFFNQVYNASWQFKKYRARPDRLYVAGRWNTIYWHPNAGCGTSSVYIQNQATAGLYLYTPYRPNAAALANLYGTGDGCSSYGNRNFWRMFTDWFGSTHGGMDNMIARAEGDSRVYLVSAGTKHYITTPADLTEFATGLGGIRIISKAFFDSMPTGRNATLFLRNTKTGKLALLQGGATHWFANCDLVGLWGSNCGASGYLDVPDSLFTRYKVGASMTKFGTAPDGSARMLERPAAAKLVGSAPKAFNGGKVPYMAKISSTLLASYQVGRTLAAPHTYIKSKTGGAQVYYVDGRDRLRPINDWTYAPEYGLSKSALAVDDSVVKAYTKSGAVGLVVSCGSNVYAASNGSFVRLKAGSGGLPVAALAAENCALLKKSAASVSGPLFLQANGASVVNLVRSAKLRQLSSPAQSAAQNGGYQPTIVKVAPTTLAKITRGPQALDVGSFVKFGASSDVFLVNGWQLVRVHKWATSEQYGFPRRAVPVTVDRRDGYSDAASPLGTFAKCGPTDVFAVTGGARQGVGAVALAGNPFTTLQNVLCAKIPVRGARIDGPLFLAAGSEYRVAVAGGFAPITSAGMLEANAGVRPAPLAVSADAMAALPARGAKPATGTLVKGSNSGAVYFVDGSGRHALPNWGVAADLGITARYSVVHPAEPALLKTENPPLGVFVKTGGQTYAASAGKLNKIAPELAAGFAITELTEATGATLAKSTLDIRSGLVLKDASTGGLYLPTGGKLVAVAATALPAGATVLTLDTRTVAGMLAASP
ncbi:hypothetical protein [Agromyces sp. NPDC058110]|uniref:hypothetical protein n=1 Tax=Agromyces sp. NPDC058110 TaxID=3346345 RepID=UPI0036D7A6FD